MSTAATGVWLGAGGKSIALRATRGSARCRAAAGGEGEGGAARVRIFKGGSAEVRFGAKQNMLGCLERADDAGVAAAIDELSGMNPTEAPARSPALLGKWRLVWSKQATSANPFQRAFGKAAKKNYQIVKPGGELENLVELGPLTVSGEVQGRARIRPPSKHPVTCELDVVSPKSLAFAVDATRPRAIRTERACVCLIIRELTRHACG